MTDEELEPRLRRMLSAHAEQVDPTLSGPRLRARAEREGGRSRLRTFAPALAAAATVAVIAVLPQFLDHGHGTRPAGPGSVPSAPAVSSTPAPTDVVPQPIPPVRSTDSSERLPVSVPSTPSSPRPSRPSTSSTRSGSQVGTAPSAHPSPVTAPPSASGPASATGSATRSSSTGGRGSSSAPAAPTRTS